MSCDLLDLEFLLCDLDNFLCCLTFLPQHDRWPICPTQLAHGVPWSLLSVTKCNDPVNPIHCVLLLIDFFIYWIGRLDTLTIMGFDSMTPVQSGAIPLFMKNKDVVVEVISERVILKRTSGSFYWVRLSLARARRWRLLSLLSRNYCGERILWRGTKWVPWSSRQLGKVVRNGW